MQKKAEEDYNWRQCGNNRNTCVSRVQETGKRRAEKERKVKESGFRCISKDSKENKGETAKEFEEK